MSATGKTPLHQACIRLEIPPIEDLLQLGDSSVDINARDIYKATSLHYAVLYQQLSIGVPHRREGVVPGYSSKAIRQDDQDDYLACLDLSEDEKCACDPDRLEMFSRVRPGGHSHVKVIRMLLDHGADLAASDLHGRTPLMIASSLGYVDIAHCLIEKGADVEQVDIFGTTALNEAVRCGHDDLASLLLPRISKTKISMLPAEEVRFNETDLHIAAGRGFVRSVETLLRYGADPNVADDSLYRPLHIAIENEQYGVVDALLQAGADVNAKNLFGNTPTHLMVLKKFDEMSCEAMHKCFKHGADIEARNYSGRTALHLATCWGSIEWLRALIVTYNADVNASDNYGNRALHVIFMTVRPNVSTAIEVLADQGAAVNATNAEEMTPLHFACIASRFSNTRLLVERGANCAAADSRGLTPLHYVFHYRKNRDIFSRAPYTEPTNLLLKHGASVDARTRSALLTPLHLACRNPDTQNCTEIVDNFKTSWLTADVLGNIACHYDLDGFANVSCGNGQCHTLGHVKNQCGISAVLANVNFRSQCFRDDDCDKMGRTILHVMLCRTLYVVYDFTLQSFISKCQNMGVIEKMDYLKRTGLHYLCIVGIVRQAEHLYLNGQSGNVSASVFSHFRHQIDCRDHFGRTALFYAALYKPAFFTENLLLTGADPGIADNDGILPEDIAAARRMSDIAQLLVAKRRELEGNHGNERNDKCFGRLVSVVSLNVEQKESDGKLETAFREITFFTDQDSNKEYATFAVKKIFHFIENLMERVALLDTQFSCYVSLVGSAHENTRVHYPEELDCLVVLTCFEQIVEAEENADFPHCATFRRKLGNNATGFESFFSSNGILQTQVVKDKLYALVIEATSSYDVWQDGVFEFLKLEIKNKANSPAVTVKLVANRMWIGNTLFIHQADTFPYQISVDLVPSLRTGRQLRSDTPFAIFAATVDDDMKESYAVFKQPNYVFGPEMNGLCPVAHVKLESELIRRSPRTVRAAYMWLKLQYFLMESLHKYMLKTCLLHCLVNDQFDEVAFSDIITEESLRSCLRTIAVRLKDSIDRDDERSISNPENLLPVWEFEPFAHYSIGLLAQLGLRYPKFKRPDSHGCYAVSCMPTDVKTRELCGQNSRINKTVCDIHTSYEKVSNLCSQLAAQSVPTADRTQLLNIASSDDIALMRKITMYEDCRNDWFSFISIAKSLDMLDSPYLVSTDEESVRSSSEFHLYKRHK